MTARAALPYWPATMKRATAARYCELTVPEFEREVNEGRLPLPFMLGNHEHWSRRKLDEAIAAMENGGEDVWSKLGLGHAA